MYYLRKSATYHDDPDLYDKHLQKTGSGGSLLISHAELIDRLAPFRERIKQAWLSRNHKLTETIYDGEMISLTHCCDSYLPWQALRVLAFCQRQAQRLTQLVLFAISNTPA